MNAPTILILLVAIVSADFLLEQVLRWLNIRRFDPVLPAELNDFYDEEEYARSQSYLRTRARFGLMSSVFSFVLLVSVLVSGLPGDLDTWLRQYIEDPGLLAIVFFAILFLASDLLSTPFSLYSTFVIEERFGFNKTSLGTYFLDKVKGYLLGALIGGALIYALVWFAGRMEKDFWLWFWGVLAVLMLALQYVYTTLLMPLFNKLKPLEAGELRSAIESYCRTVDFPLTNIMVMNGSKRSTKANAFFAGFGKQKRIVLYDTLIAQLSQDELVAVLAHEVGHYKRRHIFQGYFFSVLNIGVMLFVLSRLLFEPSLSLALGAEQAGVHLALLTFGLLYSPVSLVIDLFLNAWSRRNEYQADAYASHTYDADALGKALTKLHVGTLSNLRPHPAYVFVHFSHPTLLQRLAAIHREAHPSADALKGA